MNPPRYVYHASPECVHDSIMLKGLVHVWEGVYAASTPSDALRFMAFRLFDHYHGSKTMVFGGKEIMVPDIVHHDTVEVWKIDTKKCPNKWQVGTDHSVAVFGDAQSWVHAGDIPLSAVVSWDAYSPAKVE